MLLIGFSAPFFFLRFLPTLRHKQSTNAGTTTTPGGGGNQNTITSTRTNVIVKPSNTSSDPHPTSTGGGGGGGGGSGGGNGGNGGGGGKSSTNAGAIAGGVVGGVLGLALIALLAFLLARRTKRNKEIDGPVNWSPNGGHEPKLPEVAAAGTGANANANPFEGAGYDQPYHGQPQGGPNHYAQSTVTGGAAGLGAGAGYYNTHTQQQPQFPQQQQPQYTGQTGYNSQYDPNNQYGGGAGAGAGGAAVARSTSPAYGGMAANNDHQAPSNLGYLNNHPNDGMSSQDPYGGYAHSGYTGGGSGGAGSGAGTGPGGRPLSIVNPGSPAPGVGGRTQQPGGFRGLPEV